MKALQKKQDHQSLLSMFDDTARMVDEHIANFKNKRQEILLPATQEEENSDIESVVESEQNEMNTFMQNEIDGDSIGNKSPTVDTATPIGLPYNEMFYKILKNAKPVTSRAANSDKKNIFSPHR